MRLTIFFLVCAAVCAAQDDIAAGAKTFRSHCSPCHGLHGEGGLGPNLASGHFYHGSTDVALLQNISNGIPGTAMPGLFYSPDRIKQVVAYVRSLNAASQGSLAGDPSRGAEVFRAKNCAQCHRVHGEGGRLGPDLSQIGQSRSPEFLRESIVNPSADVQPRYWVVRCRDQAGHDYQGFLMNEDTYSVQFIDTQEKLHSLSKVGLSSYRIDKTSLMPPYQGSVSKAELDDLVAYLSSLRPAGGTE